MSLLGRKDTLITNEKNVPLSMRPLLNDIVSGFSDELGSNLVGIYLHGSATMGCFNPAGSDLDFLVVVARAVKVTTKQRLADLLLRLNERAPANGLEMSVVTLRRTRDFRHPTPYELHFSKAWAQRYRAHTVNFAAAASDVDLAAHFTMVKQRGVRLMGHSIADVFYDVPARHYLDSIVTDTRHSLDDIAAGVDSGECRVPPYAVLNACRVLAYVRDGLMTSKTEGGQWGLEHLPPRYEALITAAIGEYAEPDSSRAVDAQTLKAFGRFVGSQLKATASAP